MPGIACEHLHVIWQVTLTGHRRAVTALRYSQDGSQLASGSQDTDVILWDVIGETGLFRLRAHTAEVTDLVRLLANMCRHHDAVSHSRVGNVAGLHQ